MTGFPDAESGESSPIFPPGRSAALARLAAVAPADYAGTRNHLDGAVTRLSPYLTHGLLGLDEVVGHARSVLALDGSHKLINEFGWRAYWQHVFSHLGEQGIRDPRYPPPAPVASYAGEVPLDVREARTGLIVIDWSVRTLYNTGYLHNHARMWLASYLVHLRRVDWRTGADWMIAHLLDGDLASNTLSWQWVAGTWTGRPYLFNAGNVARFAPALAQPDSPLDHTYEAMAQLAARPDGLGPLAGVCPAAGIEEPAIVDLADASVRAALVLGDLSSLQDLQGRAVVCRHPFAIGWRAAESAPGIGVLIAEWQYRYRWSKRRWRFVLQSLNQGGNRVVLADSQAWSRWLFERQARAAWPIHSHLASYWPSSQSLEINGAQSSGVPPRLDAVQSLSPFAEPDRFCPSFSVWWRSVQQQGTFRG